MIGSRKEEVVVSSKTSRDEARRQVLGEGKMPQQDPHHAGSAPDVSRGAVASPEQHLQTPVLPGLDVLGEVVVHPAGIPQVGNLHLHVTHFVHWVWDMVDGLVVGAGGHSPHPPAGAAAACVATNAAAGATIVVSEVGTHFLPV